MISSHRFVSHHVLQIIVFHSGVSMKLIHGYPTDLLLYLHLARYPDNVKDCRPVIVTCWAVQLSNEHSINIKDAVFSYNLRCIVVFRLVEMAISTNLKTTIYRNLYDNTDPDQFATYCLGKGDMYFCRIC